MGCGLGTINVEHLCVDLQLAIFSGGGSFSSVEEELGPITKRGLGWRKDRTAFFWSRGLVLDG